MTLPPLRVGVCTIGPLRLPAIVGEVKGRTREIFVCGVHIDRFLTEQEARGTISPSWAVRIDAAMFARTI